MRFNWDEFKDADNKIAVHCKTEEEAKDFKSRERTKKDVAEYKKHTVEDFLKKVGIDTKGSVMGDNRSTHKTNT